MFAGRLEDLFDLVVDGEARRKREEFVRIPFVESAAVQGGGRSLPRHIAIENRPCFPSEVVLDTPALHLPAVAVGENRIPGARGGNENAPSHRGDVD